MKETGHVIWLTGLSGSGKSTLGSSLTRFFRSQNIPVKMLDGDEVRKGLSKDLGFSSKDRTENIRRVAEVAKLLSDSGVLTICCFISPTEEIRTMAKEILQDRYIEVYVNTPLAVCEKRDVKGLYEKARAGEIPNFTGVSAPYDKPMNADVEVQTENQTIDESVQALLSKLKEIITS